MENAKNAPQLPLDYTFVLDASGSMHDDVDEVLAELNQQLQTLKETYQETKRPCSVTIAKFDTRYTLLREGEAIEQVALICPEEYKLGGMTALYDAMGISIKRADARVGFKVKRNEAEALVLIFTDGLENASVEFTARHIRKLIEDYQNRSGWEIAFVGTDISAILDLRRQHFRADKMRHYQQHQKGEAMRNITASVDRYYSRESASFSFSSEQDEARPDGSKKHQAKKSKREL